jgi:regulator of telomere elongation helicase 1
VDLVGGKSKEIMRMSQNLEELKEFGEKNKLCPYYFNHSIYSGKFKNVDILVCPYLYILKPDYFNRIFQNFNKNKFLKPIIFVFDEAHNIDQQAEDYFNFKLNKL